MRVTEKKRIRSTILLLICLIFFVVPTLAQDEEPTGRPPVERLVITDSDVSRVPSIELLMFGRDNQGNALDFSTETVRHYAQWATCRPY